MCHLLVLGDTSEPLIFVLFFPFQGQNNLFHTIVFFLHHVKTKHYGMLG